MRTPVSTPGRDTGREKALGTGVPKRPVADSEDTNGSYAPPYRGRRQTKGEPRDQTGRSDVETAGHRNGASFAQEPKPGREETHQPEPK
jgi:hypothetical protein